MTPAVIALQRLGVEHRLLEYRHDPAVKAYGLEAAQALDLPPAAVFKTLVIAAPDGRLFMALAPVTGELDLKRAAAALGCKRLAMAEGPAAARATGYVLGGISPFGQRRRLEAVVDASVREHERVYVSGGRRGLEIELSPRDLIQQAGAGLATITRGEWGLREG